MAKASGTRRKESARKAAKPMRASITRISLRRSKQKNEKADGGERHEDRHGVGEPAERDLELRGGLAGGEHGLPAQPQPPGQVARADDADRAGEDVLDAEQPLRRDRVEK